jgi:hypothetical protein
MRSLMERNNSEPTNETSWDTGLWRFLNENFAAVRLFRRSLLSYDAVRLVIETDVSE